MVLFKFKSLLVTLGVAGSLAVSLMAPVAADTASICQPNSGYGYFAHTSSTTYAQGSAVGFCLQDSTRTPFFYSSTPLWRITNAIGQIVYSAPMVQREGNHYYPEQNYVSSWNQQDDNGHQVQPGTYHLVFAAAPVPTQTTFNIGGSSDSSTTQPYILLNSYNVYPEAMVQVNGYGFIPFETVNVSVVGYHQPTVTTDANGSFSASFTTPKVGNAGTYAVVAKGISSGRQAAANFYINSYYPNVMPSSYYILPGQSLGFMGNGFRPNETIKVYDQAGMKLIKDILANNAGEVNAANVTTIAYGTQNTTQTFVFKGLGSDTTRTVAVTVGAYFPQIHPSTYYLPAGQSLNVSSSGFAPNETVRLKLNGNQVKQSTSDSSGNVTFTNVMATTSPQSFTIVLRGDNSQAADSRTVTAS